MIKQTIPLNRVGHGGYGAYALVPPKPLLLQYCGGSAPPPEGTLKPLNDTIYSGDRVSGSQPRWA
jgi:hypothetical protein